MELFAEEFDDPALEASLAEAEKERDDYEASSADRPECVRFLLVKKNEERIENELRHRFAQVLGAKW